MSFKSLLKWREGTCISWGDSWRQCIPDHGCSMTEGLFSKSSSGRRNSQ